jgi:hypothetical protein
VKFATSATLSSPAIAVIEDCFLPSFPEHIQEPNLQIATHNNT